MSEIRSGPRVAAVLLLVSLSGCLATPPAVPRETLRVGTSGDYAPFSVRVGGPGSTDDGPLRGFDIAVAKAFARDTGRRLEWVPFRWPELLHGLAADHFDVAMSGVTVRPDRSLAGRFSLPVVRSGAVVLVPAPDAAGGLSALDRPGVAIAVNRGGHLERVARAHFEHADLRPIDRNADVLAELLEGRARGVVTDTLEAPHWLARAPGLVALAPFTADDKAYLVRSDRPELARALDAWLLAREADGTLARLRAEHFGPGEWPATAAPEPALEAARRERLALMPLVAEAKRRSGAAVEDLAREQRVLAAAAAGVERAARERGVAQPDPDTVRAYFERQIADAKRVQREVLSRPPDPALAPADLALEIRPALLRIGDRIAWLLVEREQSERGSQARGHPLDPCGAARVPPTIGETAAPRLGRPLRMVLGCPARAERGAADDPRLAAIRSLL